MSKQQETVVVGLGEVLWDCFDDSRLPGGAPANVAFHAQQLGLQGVVCSRVGKDELGDELLEYLSERGLDTKYIQCDEVKPTGYVTVDTSNPQRPSFIIHENVAWDFIEFDRDLEQLMKQASAVCFGTLAQRHAISRESIQRCLQAASNALIVYDVNIRQHWYHKDWMDTSLQSSHIAKLNIDEVDVLDEVLRIGSKDCREFAFHMIDRYNLKLICITRAEDGCLLISPDQQVDAAGVKVDVADAVGAGDAFTAALIMAQLKAWPLQRIAEFANRVGALVAGQPGAMPHLVEEYRQLMN